MVSSILPRYQSYSSLFCGQFTDLHGWETEFYRRNSQGFQRIHRVPGLKISLEKPALFGWYRGQRWSEYFGAIPFWFWKSPSSILRTSPVVQANYHSWLYSFYRKNKEKNHVVDGSKPLFRRTLTVNFLVIYSITNFWMSAFRLPKYVSQRLKGYALLFCGQALL